MASKKFDFQSFKGSDLDSLEKASEIMAANQLLEEDLIENTFGIPATSASNVILSSTGEILTGDKPPPLPTSGIPLESIIETDQSDSEEENSLEDYHPTLTPEDSPNGESLKLSMDEDIFASGDPDIITNYIMGFLQKEGVIRDFKGSGGNYVIKTYSGSGSEASRSVGRSRTKSLDDLEDSLGACGGEPVKETLEESISQLSILRDEMTHRNIHHEIPKYLETPALRNLKDQKPKTSENLSTIREDESPSQEKGKMKSDLNTKKGPSYEPFETSTFYYFTLEEDKVAVFTGDFCNKNCDPNCLQSRETWLTHARRSHPSGFLRGLLLY